MALTDGNLLQSREVLWQLFAVYYTQVSLAGHQRHALGEHDEALRLDAAAEARGASRRRQEALAGLASLPTPRRTAPSARIGAEQPKRQTRSCMRAVVPDAIMAQTLHATPSLVSPLFHASTLLLPPKEQTCSWPSSTPWHDIAPEIHDPACASHQTRGVECDDETKLSKTLFTGKRKTIETGSGPGTQKEDKGLSFPPSSPAPFFQSPQESTTDPRPPPAGLPPPSPTDACHCFHGKRTARTARQALRRPLHTDLMRAEVRAPGQSRASPEMPATLLQSVASLSYRLRVGAPPLSLSLPLPRN